jgi:hypothetical protein
MLKLSRLLLVCAKGAGERKTVEIPLPSKLIAYWDVDKKAWTVERDNIKIRIGSSSADIRLKRPLKLSKIAIKPSFL